MAYKKKTPSVHAPRRKRAFASVEARCVCGAPLAEGRACVHCPACSAKASQAWRDRSKAEIRVRRRHRREQRFSSQVREANARAYLAVYVSRGKVKRAPCACGSEDVQPIQRDFARPLEVEWKCKRCVVEEARGVLPLPVEMAVAEPVSSIAPPRVSSRRSTIREEIAALSGTAAARFADEVARRRPRGIPAEMWLGRSGVIWLDAAIQAYDVVKKEEDR
jgi:hypothetical protein